MQLRIECTNSYRCPKCSKYFGNSLPDKCPRCYEPFEISYGCEYCGSDLTFDQFLDDNCSTCERLHIQRPTPDTPPPNWSLVVCVILILLFVTLVVVRSMF
jgi:uncharacterized protein (DUF983 family)